MNTMDLECRIREKILYDIVNLPKEGIAYIFWIKIVRGKKEKSTNLSGRIPVSENLSDESYKKLIIKACEEEEYYKYN